MGIHEVACLGYNLAEHPNQDNSADTCITIRPLCALTLQLHAMPEGAASRLQAFDTGLRTLGTVDFRNMHILDGSFKNS